MKAVTSIVFLLSVIVSIHGLRTRIYGGRNALEKRYPYQALIHNSTNFCGGSIINKRWILTAAHCLNEKNVNSVVVVVGTTSLSQGSGATYQAEKLIYHQSYDDLIKQNDIGLVRVNKDIKFNSKVQPIKLAENETVHAGETVVLTGWGQIAKNVNPNELQRILLKIYDFEKCKQVIGSRVIETQICALSKKNEGPCFGDSGGPLVNKNGIQVGIVAYTLGCGEGYPDVYTQVSSFRDWINEKIGKQ